MHFHWLDGLVLGLYFVSMLAIGLYQTRKVKSTGDFFAGGRTFNKFLMMMHALGTGTHADDPVVVVGASFKYGLAGIWYTFVYLFVTPFYWLIAPFFRRSRYLTTADFFEARFGTALSTLYAVWGTLIFAVNMGTLLIGTGKIVSAASMGSISPTWGIIGMTIAFLIYGTAGGLFATVFTEAVQGLLIVVMSLMLVPFGLAMVGWFSGLHRSVDPSMFRLTGLEELSIWWILAGSLMNLINIVAQPHTMEVCASGKTEFEGRIGFTYGNFIKRFCALGWAMTGVIVAALVSKGVIGPIAREDAFGTAIRVLLPAGLGLIGLMFAAILAAQMSSLSAFMVAASALISRNVYKKHINPAADDPQLLRVARFAGFIIVVLGVAFALGVGHVADALMWFWTLATFTGLFMWAGVLWRRANATGAWASFAVMLAIWLYVGEPGQAWSQHTARWMNALPHTVASYNSAQPKFTRLILDIVSTRDDKLERKQVLVLFPKDNPTGLGVRVRELTDADRANLRRVLDKASGGRGTGGSSVSGSVVAALEEGGSAKSAGIKPGDVILRCARLSTAGIFADKSLLHYRLLAFLPAGILALVIGSLLGKPMPKDKLDKFYALIKTPVGREKELIEQGVDVVYAGSSEGHPWELKHQTAVNVIGFLVALAFSGFFFLLLWILSRLGA
ncbi:MAG: sodium:solute symporter family protein [Armatimonadota bacterium]|nr:sodium:solute symporter family protein [Armatimonadota bacterium]